MEKIINNYRNACEELAQAVNDYLFDGEREMIWSGGLCDFGACEFLSPDEMAEILESGMTREDYREWSDWKLNGTQYINLHSWVMGLRPEMLKQ